MNIQSISQNNNLTFQSKLRGKYANDMIDYVIKNPRGGRKIVDGINNILKDGKNDIIELNYSGYKFIDFIFPGAYQYNRIKQTPSGIEKIKNTWNYCFIGGGIGVQSEIALAEINNGKIENENIILDGMKNRLIKKQKEIFDEYDYGTGDEKKIKTLHKHYDYLEKKYQSLIKEEAIKLKKIISQG